MAARTGREYLDGLRDSRSVWVNGEAVCDVTESELFRGSLAGMAGYFDWQHKFAETCIIESDLGICNVSHLIPKSANDLKQRREGLYQLAKYSVGMLGRTPDYVNVTFAGFAGQPSIWKQEGNEAGYENLCRFQREIAEKDLSLTHTIVHPIVDKRVPDYEGVNQQLALRKVGETSDSIIVSGARILATLGPFADELAVYPGHPIPPSQPDIAIAFSVPMNAPGLKCSAVITMASIGMFSIILFPVDLMSRMRLSSSTKLRCRSTVCFVTATRLSLTAHYVMAGLATSCSRRLFVHW